MNRYKEARNASIIGIMSNLFLLIIKVLVSLISNSMAMLGDAMNSASDVFSSVMSYIGNKIASKPRDEDHDLGHGKAEYIFSLLISITMFYLGMNVLLSSSKSLLYGSNIVYSKWLVYVCIITIITKTLLFIYTNKVSKKYKNLLMKANSKDHRNDIFLTSLNLVACIFSKYGITYIDGIVGILISIWIFITSIKIFIESYDVLMDKSMSNETKEKVLSIINKHKEIQGFRHFNATPVGYKYQISFTIFIDGNLTTFESHEIADKLEKEINKKIDEVYLTVIHVNPIEVKSGKKRHK